MPVIFILAAVVLAYWAYTKGYIKLDGGGVGQLARTMGGYALIGTAISFLGTGRYVAAIPVALIGLWLLGFLNVAGLKGFAPPGVARQRSALLDIGIDAASGRITGTVIDGPLAGRVLDSLSRDDSYRLASEMMERDPAGLRLFAIYLDGRFPGWREDLQRSANPGTGHQPRPGVMTHQEAQKILGLGPDADEAAIRDAHRRLIVKLHPDVGGSDALAALVNEAKDVLLRRHR